MNWLFLAIAFPISTLANTEVTAFKHTGHYGLSSLSVTPMKSHQGTFSNSKSDSILALSLEHAQPGTTYVARISWPADCPSDVSIDYNDITSQLVLMGSKRNVVRLVPGEDIPVPFAVQIDPLKLNVFTIFTKYSVGIVVLVLFAYILRFSILDF